jgi:hypothetical protein
MNLLVMKVLLLQPTLWQLWQLLVPLSPADCGSCFLWLCYSSATVLAQPRHCHHQYIGQLRQPAHIDAAGASDVAAGAKSAARAVIWRRYSCRGACEGLCVVDQRVRCSTVSSFSNTMLVVFTYRFSAQRAEEAQCPLLTCALHSSSDNMHTVLRRLHAVLFVLFC